MFFSNGYPYWFFNKILRHFLNDDNNINKHNSSETDPKICYVTIPFIGKESRRFGNRLAKLLHTVFDVKVSVIYKTFKTGNYFQLKSRTPLNLCSNVVYKFTCSCDSNLTYIGKSSRHLSTRVREHLNLADPRENSAIKQHIISCNCCSNIRYDLNSFTVLKHCKSDFYAKIHEALLIKKHRPGLNKQLHAHGSSFLLNLYK